MFVQLLLNVYVVVIGVLFNIVIIIIFSASSFHLGRRSRPVARTSMRTSPTTWNSGWPWATCFLSLVYLCVYFMSCVSICISLLFV